ncbi:hypothetical protein AcW1_002575 [Taiwanofungus camphoratus]|nr:hypothetical protein AcW1_002575 [Antrodia cinnamomea]
MHSSSDEPIWHTSTASYVTGNLNQGRTALLIDIGESVPQISIESFLNNILPPLPEGVDVDEVITKLKKQGHITRSNRWRAFKVDPRHSRLMEDKAFDPLKEISNAIVKATAKLTGADNVLDLQNNPNVIPSSYTRSSKTRPDGCLILRRRGDVIRWADIGLSCEYKKLTSKKEEYDNVSKVIWSMHHCMRDDPRRRFTFGLTIEDTRMKLWSCSRAELLVSDSFDFMHEHRIVTSFFISLMYAKEHEIGWDPTMKFAKDGKGKIQYHSDGTPRYDITVRTPEAEEVVYHTIGVLSDVGANAPLGRGTRVWEARKVVGNKEYSDPVALKDSWIDSDRDREGDLSASLRDSASSEEDREDIDARFLTVLHHGDVYIDGNADDTRTLMTRSMEIPSECSRYNVQISPEDILSGSNTGTGHYRTPQEYNQEMIEPMHHPKAHYRIVFKEVCKPLYKITSLALILKVLSHILHALQLMHRSGWVHRDISTGNILVDKDGNGRLGDLEYAKRMGQPSSHEVRTGTADFIAVEIDSQKYLFQSQPDEDSSSGSDDDSGTSQVSENQSSSSALSTDSSKGEDIRFRYNPLHDLESVWWVAVYFLIKKKVVRDSGEDPAYKEDLATQMAYASQLFYGKERLAALGHDKVFSKMLYCLHHPIVRKFGQVLEKIRQKLTRRYRKAERLGHIAAIDHRIANRLHKRFSRKFLRISKGLCIEVGPLSTQLRQNHQAQTKDEPEDGSSKQNVRKRQREQVEEDRDNIEESAPQGSGSRDGNPSSVPLPPVQPTSRSKKRRSRRK